MELTLFLEASPLTSLSDIKRKIFLTQKDISTIKNKKIIKKTKKIIELHEYDGDIHYIVSDKFSTDVVIASGKKVLLLSDSIYFYTIIS